MTRRRRIALKPGDFVEVCTEQVGPVRVRWFGSLRARPAVDGARAGERVPAGAIVWTAEPGAFPEAAVETPTPAAQDGPRTLSEPSDDVGPVLTLRDAVDASLALLPAGLREDAADEVESALAAVGA